MFILNICDFFLARGFCVPFIYIKFESDTVVVVVLMFKVSWST